MQVVTAAIILREGRFLLAQRRDDDAGGGLWEFPGGSVESHETPDGCVVRELREELGIDVRPVALYDAVAADWGGVLLFYLCAARGEPALLECQALRWVTPGELAGVDTHASDRALMARLAADAPRLSSLLDGRDGEWPWES